MGSTESESATEVPSSARPRAEPLDFAGRVGPAVRPKMGRTLGPPAIADAVSGAVGDAAVDAVGDKVGGASGKKCQPKEC